MQKIHVSKTYNKDLESIFNVISDHASFLTGGGLKCSLIKQGKDDINGNGAIRKVESKNLDFEEEIFDYQKNLHFAYVILSTTPKKPLFHKKGWLDFSYKDGKTQVDWHSHFKIT
ncbi:MAG: SRPBCC family protein, partial [Pseudomonadota bacterium]